MAFAAAFFERPTKTQSISEAWRPVAHPPTWENPNAHNGAITAAAARSVVAAQKRLDLEEARYRDYSRLLRDQERSHVADLGRERRTADAYRREALRLEREAAALAALLDQRDRELERTREALRASQDAVADAVAKAQVAEVRFAEEMADVRNELDAVVEDRNECRRLLEAAMTRIRKAEDVAERFEEHERERRKLEQQNQVLRISLAKVEKKCASLEEVLNEQAHREELLKRLSEANLAAFDSKKNALASYMAAMANDGAAIASGGVPAAARRARGATARKVRPGTSVKELYNELIDSVEDASTVDSLLDRPSADDIARRAFRSPEVAAATTAAAVERARAAVEAVSSAEEDVASIMDDASEPPLRAVDAAAAADRINTLLFGGSAPGAAVASTPGVQQTPA